MGYENGIEASPANARMLGIGAMLAKARSEASDKGYTNGNGIGAMSAEARTAAREKGYAKGKSNNKMGIKWEQKYAEFERCVEMPAVNSKLYYLQRHQLSTKLLVWMLRFRRRLQRMKRVPSGVNGERDFLIALYD